MFYSFSGVILFMFTSLIGFQSLPELPSRYRTTCVYSQRSSYLLWCWLIICFKYQQWNPSHNLWRALHRTDFIRTPWHELSCFECSWLLRSQSANLHFVVSVQLSCWPVRSLARRCPTWTLCTVARLRPTQCSLCYFLSFLVTNFELL